MRHHRGIGTGQPGPPAPGQRSGHTLPWPLQLPPLASGWALQRGGVGGGSPTPKPGQTWAGKFLPPQARPRLKARLPGPGSRLGCRPFSSLWPGDTPAASLAGSLPVWPGTPPHSAHRDPIVRILQTHWGVERKCRPCRPQLWAPQAGGKGSAMTAGQGQPWSGPSPGLWGRVGALWPPPGSAPSCFHPPPTGLWRFCWRGRPSSLG